MIMSALNFPIRSELVTVHKRRDSLIQGIISGCNPVGPFDPASNFRRVLLLVRRIGRPTLRRCKQCSVPNECVELQGDAFLANAVAVIILSRHGVPPWKESTPRNRKFIFAFTYVLD